MVERNAIREASAACKPGTSITRRRKPSDARGGSASNHAPQPSAAAPPPPQFLQCRVDALHLRFRGGLDLKIRAKFVEALATARDLGTSSAAVALGPYEMALSAKSREGWWHLETADLDVTMDEGKQVDGWGLTVKLRAMTLAVLGPAACAALAAEVASEMLHLVEAERVAWLDLCADVVGFDIATLDARQWVGSGRVQPQKLTPSADESKREWFLGGERTAFYVGKGAIMLRIYDKTVQLQNDAMGDKRAAEHRSWKEHGWNGVDQVTRVEFQIRKAAVKEIDDGPSVPT